MSQPKQPTSDIVLQLDDLHVGHSLANGEVRWTARGVNEVVRRSEILGVIGESGAGKTSLCRAALGLVRPPLVVRGRVLRTGYAELDGRKVQKNGTRLVGYVPQNPATAFHPMISVRRFMLDIIRTRLLRDRRGALSVIQKLLGSVGLPDTERILDSYPDMLSAGMKQRILLGLALASNPDLLVLDEPTAANDAIATRDCGRKLMECRRNGCGAFVASHDLLFIEAVADKILFLHNGEVRESGPKEILRSPATPELGRLVKRYRSLHKHPYAPANSTHAGAEASPLCERTHDA